MKGTCHVLTGREIAQGLAGSLLRPLSAEALTRTFPRAVTDSRQVQQGDLFVALPGTRVDGHQFIAEALRRGAAGVLGRTWPETLPTDAGAHVAIVLVQDPLASLQALAKARLAHCGTKVVGITGSVGKTSTKDAIASVLGVRYDVLKSLGNFNTEIGLPLTLLDLTERHQRAVLEMGMYGPGDIAALCRIATPAIGVVTNIGPTHLERLSTMENITSAKAELVESLPSDGIAVLNADDFRVLSLRRRTRARCLTYGLNSAADCRAENIQGNGLLGISFDLVWQDKKSRIDTPLLGKHSAYTALSAAAVGLADGLSEEQVAQGLREHQEAGRVRIRKAKDGATILDDTYNASPASVRAALELLAEMPGRKIAVLGDMLELGAYETEGHQEVGETAATVLDTLITIGARAKVISETARAKGLSDVRHVNTKGDAVDFLRDLLADNVYILVKGSRGMALEELVDGLCEV